MVVVVIFSVHLWAHGDGDGYGVVSSIYRIETCLLGGYSWYIMGAVLTVVDTMVHHGI